MPKRRFSGEHIVTLLRQIEMSMSSQFDPDCMPGGRHL